MSDALVVDRAALGMGFRFARLYHVPASEGSPAKTVGTTRACFKRCNWWVLIHATGKERALQ